MQKCGTVKEHYESVPKTQKNATFRCSHLIRKLFIYGHFVQIELYKRAASMKLSVPAIYRSNEQTQEFLAVNTDG